LLLKLLSHFKHEAVNHEMSGPCITAADWTAPNIDLARPAWSIARARIEEYFEVETIEVRAGLATNGGAEYFRSRDGIKEVDFEFVIVFIGIRRAASDLRLDSRLNIIDTAFPSKDF
jgi:hypothetical protein